MRMPPPTMLPLLHAEVDAVVVGGGVRRVRVGVARVVVVTAGGGAAGSTGSVSGGGTAGSEGSVSGGGSSTGTVSVTVGGGVVVSTQRSGDVPSSHGGGWRAGAAAATDPPAADDRGERQGRRCGSQGARDAAREHGPGTIRNETNGWRRSVANS